jgi:TonB family protein
MFRFLLSPIVLMAVLQQTPTVLPNAPSPSISLKAAEPTDKVPSAISDKVAHVGGSIKAPVLIYSVEPEYTERAAKKRLNGNVQVYLWVDENGNPTHVRVVKGIGMGMDEKAVEAVRQYKFRPATQDGKPVTVDLYIDVNFQIF